MTTTIEGRSMREREQVLIEKTTIPNILFKAQELQDKCEDFNITRVTDEKLRLTESGAIAYLPDGTDARFSPISPFATVLRFSSTILTSQPKPGFPIAPTLCIFSTPRCTQPGPMDSLRP